MLGMTIIILTLTILMCEITKEALGYARPNIPKENIPADIPTGVKRQIERLYSSAPKARAEAVGELRRMGKQAIPAIPFLVTMLGDDTAFPLRLPPPSFPLSWFSSTPRTIGEWVAMALEKIGKPATDALMDALKDNDWKVRANAIWALTVEENFDRLEALLFVALKEEHPKVREYAAKALGKLAGERWLENPDAVETLIATLNDEHLNVRTEAAGALGTIKDQRAVEPLIAALKAPSAEDLSAAQKVDNEYNRGRKAVFALQKKYPRIKFQREGGHSGDFIGYLHALDDTITGTSLFDDIRNETNLMGFRDGKVDLTDATIREALDAFARETKCRWIARIRSDGKVIISFKDKDTNEYSVVRGRAAATLGEIANPRAVEPLIVALRGKDPYVRREAAAALGEINDPRVVEPLIATLKDEFWQVRATAVRQLGETNDQRSFKPLITALNDEQPNVRARAAEALVVLADYRAVEALIAALKDKNSYVRWHVAAAL